MSSMQSAMRWVFENADGKLEKTDDVTIGEDGIARCRKCGEPRQTVLKTPYGKTVKLPIVCKCQEEEELRAIEAMEQRKMEAEWRKMMSNAFSSPKMREQTFEADDGRFGAEQMAKCRAYADRFIQASGELDYGLLLFGKSDSGKTFMSCCVANRLLDNGMKVVMRSMPRLIRSLDDRQERQRTEWLMKNADLLILDDLGAERTTSYGQEIVYDVIDTRYQQKRPILVSTNLTLEELTAPQDVMAERIYGRILECCLPIRVETGRKRATAERYDRMIKDLGLK